MIRQGCSSHSSDVSQLAQHLDNIWSDADLRASTGCGCIPERLSYPMPSKTMSAVVEAVPARTNQNEITMFKFSLMLAIVISPGDTTFLTYSSLPVTGALATVDSVAIPCTGADFVEEALLSATFAERYATRVSEIVIVSDQPESCWGTAAENTRSDA